MNAAKLQQLQQAWNDKFEGLKTLPRPQEPAGSESTSFADTFKGAIDSVDNAQKEADSQIQSFVSGEQENLHEVVIAMNEAKLQFQLMTEVRSKVLDTYQELMRIQV